MINTICVLNFTRMGDIIQSGPMLQAFRRKYPGATLVLIVQEAFRATAERLPMVDKVIGFDVDRFAPLVGQSEKDISRAYRQLSSFLGKKELNRIDLLINLSHTPLSATITSLLNARQVIGMYRKPDGHLSINSDWINYLLSLMQDRTLNPFNLVEIYSRLAGTPQMASELSFAVSAQDRQEATALLEKNGIDPSCPIIVLQSGASSDNRRWPQSHFAQLARSLHSQGYQPVLVGSKEERNSADEIVRRSENCAVNVAGQTTVGTLAAILEAAYKVVSNDTGTIHIAAAVKTPSVGIYLGPASAKDTAPYGNGHLIVEADLNCAPCTYATTCDNYICREQVSVQDIETLCTCNLHNLIPAAQSMHGLRVYETQVDNQGNFRLLSLNKTATGCDSELLDSYRAFWDGLLEYNDHRLCGGEPFDIIRRTYAVGVQELRLIHHHAITSFQELVKQCSKTSVEKQTMERLLNRQLIWQNEIRSYIKLQPMMSAFARFLLVRLTTVRTWRIEDYLFDMNDILLTFGRGMSLLSGHDQTNSTQTNSDVRYEESTCS